MNVLITGTSGFIGSTLCSRLASSNKVIGIDIMGSTDGALNIAWERVDLTDGNSVIPVCEKHCPDVVIHCAGIAHQKVGGIDFDTYMLVNSEATANLAKAVAERNPYVCFIFLSSVSVYGEENVSVPVSEESECHPSSDYAVSKLDAERSLIALYDKDKLHNLIILRLAPVYAREWSLNLDRRVFAPGKLAYLRFGSGTQRMSALARPNLVDFIEFLINRFSQVKKEATYKNILHNQRNLRIINVCDAEVYEFNTIIQVFKESGIYPHRVTISFPLPAVWLATHVAGVLLPKKKGWLHSCYDKLAFDLVFDTGAMLGTGFRPVHSLEAVFNAGTLE